MMRLNGMTVMVMAEATIQKEPLLMFVLTFPEHQRVQPLVETDGGVMIQMEMAGRTRETDSHTNQPNGEI
jgi:hypothetical protein